jgi:hypothetical protein
MVFGILMTALGLGAICVLLYYCAVFALPVFFGLSAAFWAMNSGAGTGSVVVGFAAGTILFVIGQLIFSRNRSLVLRWVVALLFAGPAAIAGYSMVLQLSTFGISSVIWRHVFAVIGACVVGAIAIIRLGNFYAELPKASATS